jgi:hypothetical protein
MADIAVLNKDNVDYDIRDKKLADASTSSTVASGDSITIKTTNGSYVEVDRNSFVDAIRDVLGSSIKENTGGTSDVSTIPAITSDGALKSISANDIASVLGSMPSIYFHNYKTIDRTINNYFTIKEHNAYLIAFYPWAGDFAVYVLRDYDSPEYGGHVHRALVTTSGNTILQNMLSVTYVSGKTFNITGLDVAFALIDLVADF